MATRTTPAKPYRLHTPGLGYSFFDNHRANKIHIGKYLQGGGVDGEELSIEFHAFGAQLSAYDGSLQYVVAEPELMHALVQATSLDEAKRICSDWGMPAFPVK